MLGLQGTVTTKLELLEVYAVTHGNTWCITVNVLLCDFASTRQLTKYVTVKKTVIWL